MIQLSFCFVWEAGNTAVYSFRSDTVHLKRTEYANMHLAYKLSFSFADSAASVV
jgi:hypothetical protein